MARSIQHRLGVAILDRRNLVGLTQEDAAAASKISVRSWRDLEAGKTSVGLDVIEKVIKGLDWSWDDLMAVVVPTTTSEIPAKARRLFDEAWRVGTPREREIVTAALRALAGNRKSR